MKQATLTLTIDEMERLSDLLAEAGARACDDGREDSRDGALLYKAARLAREGVSRSLSAEVVK